jgi:hypothetical protein
MRKIVALLSVGLMVVGAQASEIMVSWESNGVLLASGMEPGSTFSVEAVSNLGETFTNAVFVFDTAYLADSNGMGHVAIPMFFRVSVAPPNTNLVEIPAGINSGTDPDFGVYSLTNESVFYMDATEVTQAQWDTVYSWAINNGYGFSHSGSGKGTNHPVQRVSWYDCVKWCNARSQMEGRTPCYLIDGRIYKFGQSLPVCNFSNNGYRLPTNDEWEYAARGGLTEKRFPWGDTITHSEANYGSTDSYSYDISPTRGYHPDYDNGGFPYTSPAGSFAANGYGLYDMSGNVSEWCTDWYPGLGGTYRIIRGGSWGFDASFARCGNPYWYYPDDTDRNIGFRTVRSAE